MAACPTLDRPDMNSWYLCLHMRTPLYKDQGGMEQFILKGKGDALAGDMKNSQMTADVFVDLPPD